MKWINTIISILDESIVGRGIPLFYSALIGATVNLVTPIEAWVTANGGYIGFIMYAIAFDFILGIIVSIKLKKISFTDTFGDLAIKMLAIFGFGILFEGVKQIHSTEMEITEYLLYTVRMMVFLYPVFSASKNMSILTGGIFPPEGWFKWMSKFKKDLSAENPNKENT